MFIDRQYLCISIVFLTITIFIVGCSEAKPRSSPSVFLNEHASQAGKQRGGSQSCPHNLKLCWPN